MQLASKTLGQGFLAQKSIGNDITGYPYFHGDDPLRRYQHLLKQYPYYYSGGDLDGYLYDHSRNFGTPRLPREAYVGVFDGTTNSANMPGRVTSGTVPAITVTFWVKYTSTADVRFVNERYGSVLGWSVFQSSGSPGLVHFLSSSDGSTVTARYSAGVGLNDGEWHHIAVTGDAALGVGGIKFYIDGVLTAANTVTAGALNVFDSTQVLTIGAELSTAPSTYSLRFPGSLSDVRVYSTAKTADEIAAIYAGDHLNPDTTGLLAAYALEEESGTLLYDWSGNGNDLTVAGTMTNFWDTDADKTWSYVDSRGHSPVGPNLSINSSDLTAFTQQNSNITSNADTAPDGSNDFDLLIPTVTNATHTAFRTGVVFSNITSYTWSIYAKAGGYTHLQLLHTANFNNTNAWCNFVLSGDGSIASKGTGTTGVIEHIGNGIYRCAMTATSGASAGSGGHALSVLPSDIASRDPSFAGDGVSGIYLWGAQLQTGTEATTYSKTTATANPDVAIKPKQIGQSATYTGRTTYPGLSYVSTLQGDGSTVKVDCGSNLIPATNDFLAECWYYHTTNAASPRSVFAQRLDSGTGRFGVIANSQAGVGAVAGYLQLFVDGATDISFSIASALSANTWHKIRVVRESDTFTMYCQPLGGSELSATQTQSGITVNTEGTTKLLYNDPTAAYYNNGQITNFSVTTGGTTYTIVPERTGDRIWKMGTDGSAVLVDSAIAGTLTNVHQSGALPTEDWHLKHGGHVGTNLATYSESADNASWTKTAVTTTANATTAPNGLLSADLVVPTAANTYHETFYADVSVTSGTTYTGSYYVKQAGYRYVQLVAPSAVFGTIYAVLDLQTGTRSGGTSGYGSIESVGNGWYRVSVTMTATSSSNGRFSIGIVNSGTAARAEAFLADGVSGIYLWGAQFVQGTEALPYTPTTASSATDVHVPANYNNVAPDGEAPYYAPGVLMETRKLAPRGGVDSVFANTINLESTYTFGNERASIDPIDTKRKVVVEPIGERDFVAYKEAIPLAGSFVEENLTLNHQYTRGEDYAVVGPELTFSRASGATMFNSAGTLVWAPENLITYSEDFSNAAWSKGSGVTVESGFSSPNGVPAYRVNTASFVGETIRQTFTTLDGVGNYTFKCKIKGEGSNIGKTCSVTLSRNLGTSVSATSAVTLTDDWQDVTLNLTTLADTDGLKVFTYFSVAHATSYIISEPQLYRSPNASSTYIPTTSAAVYGMRLNSHVYEGGAWVNKGLFVEGAATNKCTNYNAAASLTNVTMSVVAGATLTIVDDTAELESAGLLGVCTGNVFQLDNTTGATAVEARIAGNTGNTNPHTASAYVRRVSGVGAAGRVGLNGQADVIAPLATYQRFSVVKTPADAFRYLVVTAEPGQVVRFILTQLEQASAASSTIVTYGSAVTRSADVATIGGTDFSGFYNASEGTWVVGATSANSDTQSFVRVLQVDDNVAPAANSFQIIRNLATQRFFIQLASVGQITDTSVPTWASNTTAKVALGYKENDVACVFDGLSARQDGTVALPTPDRLRVGAGDTGGWFNGHISSLKYYNTKKPNAFLKGITG